MTNQQRTNQQRSEDLALLRSALNRHLTRMRYVATAYSVLLGGFIVYGLLGSDYL